MVRMLSIGLTLAFRTVHLAYNASLAIQVSPPTAGDLKNTPKHRFWATSKFWTLSCLIRQLGSGEISGGILEIEGDSKRDKSKQLGRIS